MAANNAVPSVDSLIAKMYAEDWIGMSGSVYETARVLSWAPWGEGHQSRLTWLLDTQAPDGSWGGPGCYRTVPTLSALEALLSLSASQDPSWLPVALRGRVGAAVRTGLDHVFAQGIAGMPDTAAAELIVPALIERINARLDQVGCQDQASGAKPGVESMRLRPPPPVNPDQHHRVARQVRESGQLPKKLEHVYEVLAPECPPELVAANPDHELVGGSPAATAAWLATRHPRADHARTQRLQHTLARCGAPLPCATPITVFERLWVWAILLDRGLCQGQQDQLVQQITEMLDDTGVAGVPGLPSDADDTAVALYLLTVLGTPRDHAPLLRFEGPDRFVTYPQEATSSPTTNAHALDALGAYVSRHPDAEARHHTAYAKAATWLCTTQTDEGLWHDKWHASPLYAVYSCARALHRHGPPEAAPAVQRSCRWLLQTQQTDGSWGYFGGTAEETAYAVLTLQDCTPHDAPQSLAMHRAAARGHDYLKTAAHGPAPPLWHDKDLYTPPAITEALRIAACHQADRLYR